MLRSEKYFFNECFFIVCHVLGALLGTAEIVLSENEHDGTSEVETVTNSLISQVSVVSPNSPGQQQLGQRLRHLVQAWSLMVSLLDI